MTVADGKVDDSDVDQALQPAPPPRTPRRLAPQPGVTVPPPDARLPRVTLAPGVGVARVSWLGVHGGAGETTLAQLLEDSRACAHAWPVLAPNATGAPPAVVLVARTHATGLQAAQAAATEWAAGDVQVRLLGAALVADAPGRLPRELRDLEKLVAGGLPAVWRVPWHEPWRLGERPDAASAPLAARKMLAALEELTAPSAPASQVEVNPGAQRPHLTQPQGRGVAGA